jgi:hypothetical protein
MKLVKQQATQLASQEAHYHFHVCPTIQQGPSPGLTREDIINLLDTPAFHLNDVEHILEIRELIPNEDRARAERLLNAREFRNWIMAPRSQELLIHGDFTGTRRVSGLSWLCCCLLHALQQTQRFYSLTFFCGCHLDATDPHAGGRGIIRSLLLQLLWRQEYTLRDEGVNWELIQAGDIHHLCFLFELVLRHLSPDSVVFCIIDGIKYYERDQYLPEMYEVLRFLLDLTQGDRLQSVFKLLVASPSPTTEVRHIFNQDGIMTMASLPINADKSSSLRVLRHLENLG